MSSPEPSQGALWFSFSVILFFKICTVYACISMYEYMNMNADAQKSQKRTSNFLELQLQVFDPQTDLVLETQVL